MGSSPGTEAAKILCAESWSDKLASFYQAEMRLWIQKQLQSNQEVLVAVLAAVLVAVLAKIDSWLKEQLDMLGNSLDQAAREESVATLCSNGSRTDTPDVKIDSWLKNQLETSFDSALKEGSVATLDVESVAAVPLVQLPYADFRAKEKAGSTAPVLEGPSFAELEFSFEGMDYDAVIGSAETTIGMVEAIRRSVAEEAGIQPDQIRVTLAPGSVKVKISIACADTGSSVVVLQRAIKSDGEPLLRRVCQQVAKVPGAKEAQKSGGDLTIGNIRDGVISKAEFVTVKQAMEQRALFWFALRTMYIKDLWSLFGSIVQNQMDSQMHPFDAGRQSECRWQHGPVAEQDCREGAPSISSSCAFPTNTMSDVRFDNKQVVLHLLLQDVHTPSDCSIGGGVSDAAIAKTVEELVATVSLLSLQVSLKEERTPSAHESALEEQQQALAVKDQFSSLSTVLFIHGRHDESAIGHFTTLRLD
eukprot:Skav206018  [mRNA]  locus=scaffold3015:78541:84767:+ [translate_table: standard]